MAKQPTTQELLVKAKLYRFTSLLFVTIGIIIFAGLYIKNVDGQLFEALKSPQTIFIFLAPFLPAAILTMLADKADKKYKEALKKDNTQK